MVQNCSVFVNVNILAEILHMVLQDVNIGGNRPWYVVFLCVIS